MVNATRIIQGLFVFFCLFSSIAQAVNISVKPDRSVVQQDESLTVEFSSTSEPDELPNFSPLNKDFQIINTNQSSNIQFINGQMSQSFNWQVMLLPKRSGSLTIPSISFGKDKSRPVQVTVKPVNPTQKNKSTELLYIEAVVDTKKAYVQSQVIYSVRIFRAVDLVNASISELTLSDPDAVIEKLTDNKSYEKFVNGNRYIVFEKQFAIFPQHPGKLVIDPTRFLGQYRDARRILRSKRLASEKIEIDVRPIPDAIRQSGVDYWLPAKKIKLTEKWSSNIDTVNVGEPVTRTLTLKSTGLMASQLPELNESQKATDVKSYVDQPILNNRASSLGMQGIREEKIAYVPSKPGMLTLPAIEITWWNTSTEKMEVAKLPKRVVTAVSVTGKDLEIDVSQDMLRQNTGESIPDSTTEGNIVRNKNWFWLSDVFIALWLLTLLGWWYSYRKWNPKKTQNANDDLQVVNRKIALQKIKTACEQNNIDEAKSALLQWGRHQWPDNSPTSIGHIGSKVNGVLAKEVNRLNDALYNPKHNSWTGEPLWLAIKLFVQHDNNQQKIPKDSIKPLFKLVENNA